MLALGMIAAPAAHAQLTLTLTPDPSGFPGDTVSFTGTLDNPTGDTYNLDGADPTLTALGLTVDESPFNTSAPLTLEPAGSTDMNGLPTDSYTGPLFNIIIANDGSAVPGTYTGTFDITGGPSANDTGGIIATQNFSITVNAPAVPEASTTVSFGLLLAFGLGGLVVSARRRKAAASR